MKAEAPRTSIVYNNEDVKTLPDFLKFLYEEISKAKSEGLKNVQDEIVKFTGKLEETDRQIKEEVQKKQD